MLELLFKLLIIGLLFCFVIGGIVGFLFWIGLRIHDVCYRLSGKRRPVPSQTSSREAGSMDAEGPGPCLSAPVRTDSTREVVSSAGARPSEDWNDYILRLCAESYGRKPSGAQWAADELFHRRAALNTAWEEYLGETTRKDDEHVAPLEEANVPGRERPVRRPSEEWNDYIRRLCAASYGRARSDRPPAVGRGTEACPAPAESPLNEAGKEYVSQSFDVSCPVDGVLSTAVPEVDVVAGSTASEPPLDYAFKMRAAGVSFHNRDGVSRQRILAGLESGSEIRLEHEPGNLHDRHAIRLMTDKGQIGYVPAGIVDIVGLFEPDRVHAWVDSIGRTGCGLLGCRLIVTVSGAPVLVAMLDFHCRQGRGQCRPASLPWLTDASSRRRLLAWRRRLGTTHDGEKALHRRL